jgi:hypothetical protein
VQHIWKRRFDGGPFNTYSISLRVSGPLHGHLRYFEGEGMISKYSSGVAWRYAILSSTVLLLERYAMYSYILNE